MFEARLLGRRFPRARKYVATNGKLTLALGEFKDPLMPFSMPLLSAEHLHSSHHRSAQICVTYTMVRHYVHSAYGRLGLIMARR